MLVGRPSIGQSRLTTREFTKSGLASGGASNLHGLATSDVLNDIKAWEWPRIYRGSQYEQTFIYRSNLTTHY